MTALRICPLCEAMCGLAVEVAADHAVTVRPDRDDVFTRGFACRKGIALGELHHDPDRLRTPLVREGGTHREASWPEAFTRAADILTAAGAHGRDAVGVYLGNPFAHGMAGPLYGRALFKALGTRNVFSTSTVDQMAKHVACGLLYGDPHTVPVPDIDRCSLLLLVGANPATSNGSMWSVPGVAGRLRELRARGGRVVVLDPRRTRTARDADEHIAVRPGTDALLLAAMVTTLFAEDAIDLGRAAPLVDAADLDLLRGTLAPLTPDVVASRCRVEAATIRRLALELAAAEAACIYGRLGISTQRFGTLTTWLVELLNLLPGNLDTEGGSMFGLAAAGQPNAKGEPGRGRGFTTGRWASRVRGFPEILGEFPAACLAEEITTPGEGQIRALITLAANPVLSAPSGPGLARALDGLDGMISVDHYLNETTQHADVVLPPPSALERPHYDLWFAPYAIRTIARYSAAPLPVPAGAPEEWEILLRLAAIAGGAAPDADLGAHDDAVARRAITDEQRHAGSPIADRDPDDVLAGLAPRRGPERLLDLALRCGPFGLGLDDLLAAPHGLDLGPLQPRLPDVLRTPDGRIGVAAPPLLADVARLVATLDTASDTDGDPETLLLIGRRDARTNNSWMHNVSSLAGGPDRCTAQLHPADAEQIGVLDGQEVEVGGPAGTVTLACEVTEDVMAGVVSIPHGWGHDAPGTRLRVAAEQPGVNANVLLDTAELDPLSGSAVHSAVPVRVRAARPR